MSKLCLTLTEKTLKDCNNILKTNIHEIDLIELRVDFLNSNEQKNIKYFNTNIPVILTFRKVVDGGLYEGEEKYRKEILLEGIKCGNFDFVDLEEDLIAPKLESAAKEHNVKIIRSFHDFNGVPQNLGKKLLKIRRNLDEIPKAAVMINNTKDLLVFYKEALSIKDDNKILLGMGTFGFNTRILAAKIGSYLTFCSKEGVSAAPGHVSPSILNGIYRFREIKKDWLLIGIIGNPVMHTMSPGLHNDGYSKLGLDAVYIPFETDDLQSFLELANLLELKGFSVTVPFKNDIIPLLDNVTNGVKEIGACNTVIKIDKMWVGENTDSLGFINPLLEKYGTLKEKKVTVIGAGGAAKSALYELKKEGAKVLLLNRTMSKAEELSKQFNTLFAKLDINSINKIKEFSDVVIQTTNVGMHPLENINPLDFFNFTGKEFLYDIIYTPKETLFLKSGVVNGCKTLNGWQMLLEQGYRQFKLFTGYEYPME